MNPGYIFRLIKAFAVSIVAVYSFIHGPGWYSTLAFWISDVGLNNTTTNITSTLGVVPCVFFPFPDMDHQPLQSQATLMIERIGVSVPIVFNVAPKNDLIYKNLTNGVVHYSVTPKPGQSGASVILGHSSLYPWDLNKYGAPFALLGKLEPGDDITIRYSDGRIFRYKMRQSLVYNPLQGDDDGKLAALESGPKPLLILVTCWPVNTTQSRLALQAELE